MSYQHCCSVRQWAGRAFSILLAVACVFCLLTLPSWAYANQKASGAVVKNSQRTITPSNSTNPGKAGNFQQVMTGLYHSDEPLVRVLAYINTMKISQDSALEKELRTRLQQASSKIEQYIILYVLVSITRSDQDFSALMEHIFHFPYVVSSALSVEEYVRGGEYALASLYPWMVKNKLYERDAWLCGIISSSYIGGTLSSEASSGYEADFPDGIVFPEYWRDGDTAHIYRHAGLSQPETAWLEGQRNPPEEYAWVKSCEMPFMEMSPLNEAWGRTFDAFLPLMDLGGNDAELAKAIAAPALKLSNPGGNYNRLLGK